MTIFEPLCDVDMAILRKRLSNLSIKRKRGKNVSLEEVAEMLSSRAGGITQEKVRKELGAWLPIASLQGMDLIIRSTILRVAQKISSKY